MFTRTSAKDLQAFSLIKVVKPARRPVSCVFPTTAAEYTFTVHTTHHKRRTESDLSTKIKTRIQPAMRSKTAPKKYIIDKAVSYTKASTTFDVCDVWRQLIEIQSYLLLILISSNIFNTMKTRFNSFDIVCSVTELQQ